MTSMDFQGKAGGTIAQDYRREPLRATDFLRYPHYHQAMQQKIASTGAAPYLEVDAGMVMVYQAPNLAQITKQSTIQNERYTLHMDLQMQQVTALTFYNAQHAQNQAAGADAQNVENWNKVQEVQQKMVVLAYNPAIEDSRQRFLADSMQRASKDLQSMQKAIGAVFEWILATVETTLGNRVITLQARNGVGYSTHTNLADSISMLTREMAGNPSGSREACWEMLAGVKPATSVLGFRFVLDTMCSIWTVISSSIALHGGNGLPTPGQMHHKLMSKMDSSSPQLTYLRFRLQSIPAATPILTIRDLLKEDMDRESGDSRQLARTSSGGNARQAMYATPNAANITSMELMIENYNKDVRGEPVGSELQAGRLGEGERQQQSNSRAYAAEGMQYGGGRGHLGTQSATRKSVCTDYLYKGCTRPECKYSHPHLSELKGLVEASKSGGMAVDSKKATQLRKPSPIRPALKRPPTPIKQPPAKKLAFANVLMTEDQREQDNGEEEEGESVGYEEEGEEDTYR